MFNKSNYTINRSRPHMNITLNENALNQQKEGFNTPDTPNKPVTTSKPKPDTVHDWAGKINHDWPGNEENVNSDNPDFVNINSARNPTTILRPLEIKWPGRELKSVNLIKAQANPSNGFAMGVNPYLNYMRDQIAESKAVNTIISPTSGKK